MKLRVVIVGATGAVGRALVELLEKREFPTATLSLLASERSAGQEMRFCGASLPIEQVSPETLRGAELVFLCVGADAARRWAAVACDAGATVIDNSLAFRMQREVPLVVPQVNGDLLLSGPRLIANPNCSTIQLVLVLAPLLRHVAITRVVVSTYQSVSGTGTDALEELERQTRAGATGEITPRVYPHPIAFNCIPQVDDFLADGYSREERKMIDETRKILGRSSLAITATAVRVPVRVGHCSSVNLSLDRAVEPEEVRRWLRRAAGVEVIDEPTASRYPTPIAAEGGDHALVGRIRRDPSQEAGLDLWISCDNLRKGAALNAVEIAERLPLSSGAGKPVFPA